VTARIHETNFAQLMQELTQARARLAHLLDEAGGLPELMGRIDVHLGLAQGEDRETVLRSACLSESFEADRLRLAAAALLAGKPTDRARGQRIADFLAADAIERQRLFDDYVDVFLTKEKEARSLERFPTKEVKQALPAIVEIFLAEQNRLLSVHDKLCACLVSESTHALLVLATHVLEGYRRLKAKEARLDYDDLIEAARRLIEGGCAWVLYKLDGGIDHILIDEAQDTSPGQWDIVSNLANEFFAGESARQPPRTLFAVGDVKQSIYSFQGADPESFEFMRALLSRKVPDGGGRWEAVDLVVSFRSARAVLEAVDAVFAEGEALRGVDLGQGYKRHRAYREKAGGVAELWPPLEPRALDEPAPWNPPVERLRGDAPSTRMAGLVARRIRAMLDGELLESQGRPIEPGDILVLVRRRSGFVADLVRELKRQKVPVAGVDRLIVTRQIAVADLLALAKVALLPDDDLNLAAVLKGPFLGFSEERLFELCYDRPGSVWSALKSKEPEAQDWLSKLVGMAGRVRPYEFFAHLLGPLRGRRIFAARLGQEALDAIDEFLALALDFESRHAPTLTGFLAWMEASEVEIKRDPGPGTGGFVRVMTVHGAKGLQAPIVILPDTLISPKGRDRLVWTAKDASGLPLWAPASADRSRAVQQAQEAQSERLAFESHRLLYVAMTRAEDRLIIGGWQPKSAAPDAWYPLVRAGFERVHAPSVPCAFLARDADAPPGEVLRLTCPQQEEPKRKTISGRVLIPSLLPDWALCPPPDEPVPLRPLIPSRPDFEEAAAFSPLGDDLGRRFERGLLVHRLLQTLPDLKAFERREQAGRYLRHQAAHWSEQARNGLISEVLSVLDDPASAPLFGPDSKAEVALSGLIEGRALSGQVDRLALLGEEVWIADYKTNRPLPKDSSQIPEGYRRQLKLYSEAARHIWPEKRIRTFLLWTDGPRLMEI
jgi:ATP-dependent helicase/nuclease subunit A